MNGTIGRTALAAVLLAGALGGCGDSGSSEQAKKADAAKSKSSEAAGAKAALVRDGDRIRIPESSPLRAKIQVAGVEEQDVEQPISVPGVVEADPAKVVKVFPPVSGRIVRLDKQLGDAVKKGDGLFLLDSADLAQAYGDANKANAALALARRNLERQKELVDAEIAARKDFEQAQSDFAQAQSESERARARLAQLGATPEGRAGGRQYVLRSPIAGRVTELSGAQGGYWNDTNSAIMTVADLSSVYLTASVQEKDLAAIFVGQAARVVLNAYPSEAFTGKVRYVGEVLDPDTRTVKVRIGADNAQGRLRPGMFGRVTLSGAMHKGPVVPESALIQSGFNTRVFVEIAPGTFQSRIVKTGAQLGGRVEIVSGLKAGERVVVKEGVLLND
jgi:cobalt-zinc-cadmium efflux system membrane fusion protein